MLFIDMVDINEVIKIDGRKLVMLTISSNKHFFFLAYPDGRVKEINKIQPMKRADKDIFISKLFQIMND